jgi:cellulose synthase/poly-beta-1,6-N-acetylglucosamine synthase-like glycosyltransferase
MEVILIIIYGLALAFIFCYSLIQLQLVWKYRAYRKQAAVEVYKPVKETELPKVCVQLPIFNEAYVAERLVDQICALDYPQGLLEIQVLDDSTDETQELLKAKVEEKKQRGFQINYLHREDRLGFKAGALAEGLKQTQAELIAIFDADFMPEPSFLLAMVPAFQDLEIGMVQSRWEHLNEGYSWLTKLQAFGLDAHFSVEQGGRNAGGHFINFNGTAGVWRKSCIEDAGGWQSDTLTEDLDLSYRAQLKGWKFKFLEKVGAPAELPAAMNALKTQQFRWNKGAAECVRKNLGKVLRAKQLSFPTKLNAIFHLMNSAVFICIILLALLSIPMLMIKHHHLEYHLLFTLASVFIISLPILAWFYWSSWRSAYQHSGQAFLKFLIRFPFFLSVSMGLALHNAWAVTEGYLGIKTPFLRTPKFALSKNSNGKWFKNRYLKKQIGWLPLIELMMAFYFAFGIVLGFHYQDFGLLPFHLMLLVGFGYVSLLSFWHAYKTAA